MNLTWIEFAPLLVTASRSWRRAFDAAMAQHNLSDATAVPLLTLLRYGDRIPQGLLAERVGVEGPTIVRVLDELEREGQVERVADPHDRRVKLVRLTDEGRKLATIAEDTALALREKLLGDLDPKAVDAAIQVLRSLSAKTIPQLLPGETP